MYDIAIIGGGVNGCGIARDAAGRGYSVFLAEKGDLASGTSSGSTKLIHGGLRYLEFYKFSLVRKALREREVLWEMAPHVIRPMRFIMPVKNGLRSAWLLRLGLFLYDHIAGRIRLPSTRTLDLRSDEAGQSLKASAFDKAFEYSDCFVDDARLVILNARDAAERGAVIHSRTSITSAIRENDHWTLSLCDERTGENRQIEARFLVNAAGPWVDQVLSDVVGVNDAHNVRLVQGSHIVVPRLFEHARSYVFQNADGRIVFAIPYETDFTLIGTTDRDYEGVPESVEISPDEVKYLCDAATEYFSKPVLPEHIIWTFSAVRPLMDDGASKAHEVTRDYVLEFEGETGQAGLLNIFGGKITTYRKLAEDALLEIQKHLGPRGAPWTSTCPLPGGDFPSNGFDGVLSSLITDFSFLDASNAKRLIRSYGTDAWKIMGSAASMKDLGDDFGAGLSEREVSYLQTNEWAVSADDILWRRSKLGLRLSQQQVETLTQWLEKSGKKSRGEEK